MSQLVADAPTPSLAPYLFYDDVERAARFLQDAFGFRRTFESPDPKGGLAHAQLAHASGLLMLGHAGGGGLKLVKSAGALPALHAGVYVFVDDVDAHCERARAAGATIASEPSTTDHGEGYWVDRSYEAIDLEGHHWWFMQRLRDR